MTTTAEHIEKRIESEQEALARHVDPVYSLVKSKEEWGTAVEKLQAYVQHVEDFDPYEVTLRFEDLVRDINVAMQTVQDDIRRVSAANNPGWGLDDSVRSYARRGGLRYPSRRPNFDDNED